MYFWPLAGLLAAAAALALALAGRRATPLPEAEGASVAIYRDQISEISRDLEQGLLTPDEAEGQKAEIGRRLIAANREAVTRNGASSRAMPVAIVLLVPIIAFAIYALRGQPLLPDVPRAERIAMAQQTGDVEALLVQVEEHLARNPKDATGWKLLVPSYMALGRYADAATAIGHVLQLEAPTAERYAELAEALTLANQGLMTANADAAVAEALKLDPKLPKANYYDALSTSQKGNREAAIAKFTALLESAPADAAWRPAVAAQLQRLNATATAPALSDEQMQSAAGQTPEERMTMIRGMVDGLEARLAENGADIEGWLRLIRARTVLNEAEKARAALETARKSFATDAAALARINALAEELKL